ncbi:GNAT family N-acetyltransferase [Arthrobacter sp. L77]|uniref:GNAT family N-acetyltransferase n=1 Tax=Arthrobacter sp. L77 TaxID=1496689 RepID=UPI00068AAC31|nr:GNAT family N-acetyltransferase [Arthrobacter sp. L77]
MTPVARTSSTSARLDDDATPALPTGDDTAYDAWPGMATGRLAAVQQPIEPLVLPHEFTGTTTRELRRWINQMYKVLDADFPPYGAQEDYDRLADELDRRAADAREGSGAAERPGAFRDNPMNHRFELFQDGMLAGYLSYSLRAGTLRLHRTVVAAAFEGAGLEGVLIQKVLLDAHKRRLAALPYCDQVQAFLADNPQYRSLVAG